MGCGCEKDKAKKECNDFTKAVINIENPEVLTLFHKVVIPASMGDEEAVPPAVGKYHNTLLYYEASDNSYLYSSDGIPTKVTGPKGEQGPEGPAGRDGRDGRDGAIQYTAGTGIDISESNVISATGSASVSWGDINGSISNQTDLSDALATKQDTLTAGANIAIDADNVISATDTTYSNFTGTDGNTGGTAGLVPAPATTDAGKFLKADGTWDTAGSGGGPTVVQTTGTSTTDVMSQNATASMVFADPGTDSKIKIGYNTTLDSNNSIAIGSGAQVNGPGSFRSSIIGYSAHSDKQDAVALGAYASTTNTGDFGVAIGRSANCTKKGAVALGSYSNVSYVGEVNIGTTDSTQGYNSTNYRILTGVHDPVNAHDAATKGYVDSTTPTITMQTTDPGEGAPLAANNFIGVYE